MAKEDVNHELRKKMGLGDPPAGDPPAGDPPAGDPPAGDPPAGDPPAGDPPAGDPPAGDPPAGDPPAGDPPAGDPPAGDPPAGVSEEDVLAFLKEKGFQGSSIDDVIKPKTEEEKAKAREAHQENAMKYAIQNDIIKPADLQAFNTDQARSDQEIAFEIFSDMQTQDEPGITPDELQERFNNTFGIEEEEGSFRRKEGQQRMADWKATYLKQKYGTIYDVTSLYDNHLESVANTVNYTKAVNSQFTALGESYSGSFKDADGKEFQFNFPYPQQEIEAVKNEFLSKGALESASMGETNPETLSHMINQAVIVKLLPKLLSEAAVSYHSKQMIEIEADRRGVPPAGNGGGDQGADSTVNQELRDKMSASGIPMTAS